MSSVLVTGAYGFVGSWLTKALLDRADSVTALKRDEPVLNPLGLLGLEESVNRVEGDLRDPDLMRRVLAEYEIDTVFHLAAQTIVGTANTSPISTFETNIRGTWTLLEACRELETGRIVVASSDKAYGPHNELPYREDFALRPTYPYDVSKAATDLIARSYWHTWQLPVAVSRFANIYGGADLNFSRLVPEAVSAAVTGRRPVIRSDGTPERDYLYVEDAAAAYLAIADALGDGEAGGEAFNAGGDRPHAVSEVVELICNAAGADVEPDIQGAGTPAGEIDRQFVDSTKIRKGTGWSPKVDLEEGLGRTVEWYRAHPEALAPAETATG